jgi:large subunit ribosomal protein L25
MSRPQLSAAAREVHGKAVKNLRRQGIVPAVVFGHGYASNAIQLDGHEFELLRRRTGRNTLLDLSLDGEKAVPVLVHDIQEHPISRRPLHVDLLVVKMTEELTVEVAIVVTGESTAVERLGGVLLQLRNSVQVRALPDHLPQSVELDISPLEDFDQVLHVSDIVVPGDVTLVTDGGEPVARVQAPRVEEVAAEPEEAVEGEPTGEEEAEGGAEGETAAE